MPGNLDLALRIRADLGNAKRTLDQLERELKQVGGAGRQAAQQTTGAARAVDRVGAAAGRSSRRLDRTTRSLVGLEGSAAGAARRLSGLYLALGGLGAVALARGLADAGLEIERLEQRFTFAAGGIAAGARELAFVRFEADRLGISFGAAAQGFSSLAAAARGTAIGAEETREIFLGIAEAATVLRLSADETQGALTAVEQIISKGKVSAEELRGQLGERLPGAFQIAARAMGVTTAELDKMLEQGELLADDFLPRFAAALRQEFAEGVPDAADSAAASFARLGNSIERLQQSTASSGLLDFLQDAADLATQITDALNVGLEARPFEAVGVPAPPDQADVVRQIEALADVDPIAANQVLEGVIERLLIAVGRAQELEIELENLGEGTRVGGVDVAAGVRESLAVVEEAIRQYREIIAAGEEALFAPPEPPAAPDAADPAEEDADDRENAEERANAALERLRRQHQQRMELIGLEGAERIEQNRIQAQRRITELELQGADPEAVSRARLAADARYYRELAKLRLNEQREAREAEEERRRELARTRAAALDDLAVISRGLLDPYDRAVAEVQNWRRRTIAAFEEAGLSAAEYGTTVDREVTERLAEAADEEAERRLQASRHWRDGAIRALRDYSDAATDTGAQVEDAMGNAFRGMEDALVEFVQTGKLSFSGLVDSIIADLARIAIQQSITGPLANALFGGLGGFNLFGGGTTGAPSPGLPGFGTGHSGGIAGSLTRRRFGVPPSVFAGAPRLHFGGLASDEVPTILRRGEGVFTPEQMAALGPGGPRNIRIEWDNRGSGPPQEVEDVEIGFELETEVIRIVTRDITRGGDIGRTIQSIVPGTTL